MVRTAIDEVNPDIQCGYCSGGREYMLMEEMAKSFEATEDEVLFLYELRKVQSKKKNTQSPKIK